MPRKTQIIVPKTKFNDILGEEKLSMAMLQRLNSVFDYEIDLQGNIRIYKIIKDNKQLKVKFYRKLTMLLMEWGFCHETMFLADVGDVIRICEERFRYFEECTIRQYVNEYFDRYCPINTTEINGKEVKIYHCCIKDKFNRIILYDHFKNNKELFKKAKKQNINTAIDTSAQPFTREEPFFSKWQELMKYTDLVMLDIKHINDAEHKKLTGHSNRNILEFAKYLSDKKVPMWIRHVVVATINDKEEYLSKECGINITALFDNEEIQEEEERTNSTLNLRIDNKPSYKIILIQ